MAKSALSNFFNKYRLEWNVKVSEILIQYVEAAGRGDTDAMAKLYSKTLKASYFLAAKLCDSESEAVEITKKAYARAFCSIDKLKKPEAFEIWLKQIISAIHKDNTKFVFNDADGNAQESEYDFLPEAVLEDDRAAERVMEAIAKLTPERKTALILHYYTGMPVNVLARYFGVSESTATAILCNAKADINNKAGVRAPDYPELATLPVLTRLFKKLVAEISIDPSAVRDIFVFAIEACDAAKPQAEAEPKEEQTPAEEKAEEETVAEETKPEAEEKSEESADEQPAEETAEAEAVEAEEEKAEEESETEVEAETKDGEAEIEDNIVSFRNRINTMLGVEPAEEKAEESAAEEVNGNEEEPTVVMPADEADVSEEPTVIMIAEEEKAPVETTPVEDDAFEKIKMSIEGLSEAAESDISVNLGDDEPTIAFADFSSSHTVAKEESEAFAPAKKEEKTAPQKAKKSGLTPKIIIAAVALLVAIIVGVIVIVKVVNKDEDSDPRPTTTVAHSDETYNWVVLSALADFEEIEFLDENFSSFKDPDTGKYGLIDNQGNVVLDAQYDGFRRCSNGKDYGNGDLSASGYHVVAKKGSDEFKVVMIGASAQVDSQKHTNHATSNNTTLEGADYDERDRYYDGYAAVRRFGKWGYISDSGKIVVPYEFEAVNDIPADDPSAAYDYCRGYSDGYVAVKQDGKMGIIKIEKESYEIVVDYEYEMICQGKNGVFLANNGKEWGNIVISSVSNVGGADGSEVTTLAPVTEPEEVSIGKYTINDNKTNIRSTPVTDSDSNIIATLDEGYEISALETKEGDNGSIWVRFKYNGQDAWVSTKKLDKVN